MDVSILILTVGILVILQAVLPFMVKRTVVFGVTVPVAEVRNPQLVRYKIMYTVLSSSLSLVILAAFLFSPTRTNPVLLALLLPFIILFISMALFFFFQSKVTKLKKAERWFKDQKQVHVTELNIRAQDEMLPLSIFIIPMLITFGLIAFTVVNFGAFPDPLPTHWGPDGQPDAWTDKTYLSVLILPIISLCLNAMFIGINEMTKRSGIKLSAGNIPASKARQLKLRKYSSWLLFFVSVATTILFTFLQYTTVNPEKIDGLALIVAPLGFSALVTIAAIALAVKVGMKDSDLDSDVIVVVDETTVNFDDDRYWKGGLIYFNSEDPSIFVEKRFGIGFTLNFAHPLDM
ncbi:DUF1648 domain-containing protein [Mangrovibacillus cuniculi]|uniref:DUF1648 domain-containing protein n=1 Tax=Mangrovibacillus cuniculi TaxID=2593652 RepID=A0A7S8HEB4_9BACI|nr:DUF5808 domain-containing protein [Mangrovibacillus cuniculi]QPC45548.1 DUF1648 domain-containing protein [Mangrovibacillus cuniculi]